MLKKICTQIKQILGISKENLPLPAPIPDDSEYENILMKLLDFIVERRNAGINVSSGDIKGYLFANQVDDKQFAEWLKVFSQRWLEQPEPSQELARRLILLGECATGELGEVARRLGEGLLVVDNQAASEDDIPQEVVSITDSSFDVADTGGFSVNISPEGDGDEVEGENIDELLQLGGKYFDAGKYKLGIEQIHKAINIDPNHASAWFFLGYALYNLGRYEEAIESFVRAISIKPDFYQAWVNRGISLDNLGIYEEGIESYDRAISIKPDFYEAWGNRGVALGKLGRYEEGIESYDRAISIKPDYYETWYNRGIALYNLGRNEEGIESYDRAISIKPDYYQAWINRGIAAGKSNGYNSLRQPEDWVRIFRLEFNYKQKLLLSSFKDYPEVIKFIQQPLSEKIINQLEIDSSSYLLIKNPELNERGYQGEIISYQFPLDKYIHKETHPEGWGILHHEIGIAHYFQGRKVLRPHSFWRKAEKSYKTALETLKPREFEELHLEVLQDLIKVLLDLREIQQAEELQRRGADLLQRMLLDSKKTDHQKRELARKAAVFEQLTVDLTLLSGKVEEALLLAEKGKNTCLRWLLGIEEIPDLTYTQIQTLLNPTTAAIYWHLSPSAINVFIILPNSSTPLVIGKTSTNNTTSPEEQRPASLLQLLEWEKWLTEWNEEYENYFKTKLENKSSKEIIELENKPWRTEMIERLDCLQQILNIETIQKNLEEHKIENLILIPHRDLHRFPLHYLFPKFTCSYLPSAFTGIDLKEKYRNITLEKLLLIENPRSIRENQTENKSLPPLPFAEVEAALVAKNFSQTTTIENDNATLSEIQQAITKPHQVFHFTGHGEYNSRECLKSCLFLKDTDRLDLKEILKMDLSNYQLVCLAACETGITGEYTITDEYVGLVSAFLQTGVNYILSTLWTVESLASAILIVKFYQQLQTGKSPASALKTSQTWLSNATKSELIQWLDDASQKLEKRSLSKALKFECEKIAKLEAEKPYSHPYYWAAFTLTGL